MMRYEALRNDQSGSDGDSTGKATWISRPFVSASFAVWAIDSGISDGGALY